MVRSGDNIKGEGQASRQEPEEWGVVIIYHMPVIIYHVPVTTKYLNLCGNKKNTLIIDRKWCFRLKDELF